MWGLVNVMAPVVLELRLRQSSRNYIRFFKSYHLSLSHGWIKTEESPRKNKKKKKRQFQEYNVSTALTLVRCQRLCLCHLVAEPPILRTVLACLVACLCTWHGQGPGLSWELVNESWKVLKIKSSFTNFFLARTYSEVNGSSFQGKDKQSGWKKKTTRKGSVSFCPGMDSFQQTSSTWKSEVYLLSSCHSRLHSLHRNRKQALPEGDSSHPTPFCPIPSHPLPTSLTLGQCLSSSIVSRECLDK